MLSSIIVADSNGRVSSRIRSRNADIRLFSALGQLCNRVRKRPLRATESHLEVWANKPGAWSRQYKSATLIKGPSLFAPGPLKRPCPCETEHASGSGGGICLRTALSKDSVGVGHPRTLAGGSSALARGKRTNQPEDSQFYCPYHFLSHDRRGEPLTGSQSSQGPSFVSRSQKRADNLPSRGWRRGGRLSVTGKDSFFR
jgi:hypothetical protein